MSHLLKTMTLHSGQNIDEKATVSGLSLGRNSIDLVSSLGDIWVKAKQPRLGRAKAIILGYNLKHSSKTYLRKSGR